MIAELQSHGRVIPGNKLVDLVVTHQLIQQLALQGDQVLGCHSLFHMRLNDPQL